MGIRTWRDTHSLAENDFNSKRAPFNGHIFIVIEKKFPFFGRFIFTAIGHAIGHAIGNAKL